MNARGANEPKPLKEWTEEKIPNLEMAEFF